MQSITSDILKSSFKPYVCSTKDETKWNWSFDNKKDVNNHSSLFMIISFCSVAILFLLLKY